MRAILAAILALLCGEAMAGSAVLVAEIEIAGAPKGELSGLAYAAGAKTLHALSDKGILMSMAFDAGQPWPATVEVSESRHVRHGDETSFDLEGLAIAGDGVLLFAVEDRPLVLEADASRGTITPHALPEALLAAIDPHENDGIEAIAHSPAHRFLVIPERTPAARAVGEHVIYAPGGETWRFTAMQPRPGRIKAAEQLPDGSILVIERRGLDDSGTYDTRLRLIAMAGCRAGDLCPVTEIARLDGILAAQPFEGLARIGPGLLALVADTRLKDGPLRLYIVRVDGLP